MKNIISTIITVIICLTLSVLGFVFNPLQLDQLQQETMVILFIVCGVSALYCFVVGEITRNNSQMDKLWSILPIIYTWIVAIKGWFNIRLIIMAILVTIWGVRLTINFGKKGAYSIKFWSGEEDYRWVVLRQNKYLKNRFAWAIFDLLFISIYQNLLVLAICLPTVAVMSSTKEFNYFDIIAIVLVAGFILLETIADKQQMSFYNKRSELTKDGTPLKDIEAPYNKGFNTTGIWKYSRHPNYLSEQSIWISLYLFTIAASVCQKGVFNWSIFGACFLVLLFIGSSSFGESVSSTKYPEYKEYIRTTSKYIPWFVKK